jgi:outer membrane lipoprotein carrier protein
MLKLALAAALVLHAQEGLPAARSGAPIGAEESLRGFDARSLTIRDFTAKFTQTYRSGALGRAVVESGTVKVKRPGRMLFEYSSPEKKLFVADGSSYYFYVPRDKQVMVQNQKGDRRATARILAEGRLLDHFDCVGEEADALGRKLILVPKPSEKDANVARISVVLDAQLRLLALEIRDAEGSTSRLVFEGFKENVGLKDSDFRFEVPKGVEVIS